MTTGGPVPLGLAGLAVGSVLFLAAAALLTVAGRVVVEPSATRNPVGRLAVFALLLGVMAALEELIFRAGILGLGRAWVGTSWALSASVVLFALAHRTAEPLGLWAWVNLVLVGLLLGFVYLGWGLAPAIGLHWGWNLWEWGLGFAVSGQRTTRQLPPPRRRRVVRGCPYGPEGHPLTAIVLAAALAALWLVVL